MSTRRRVPAVLVLVALCGCGSTAAATGTSASSEPTATPTGTARPVAAPSATVSLASCGAPRARSALTVVHSFSVSPDDIAEDAAGRLWVTARIANLVVGMSTTGGAVTTQHVGGGPEGVAADGSTLYVAQQDRNAIVTVTSPTQAVVSFANRTANPGIDGIAVDTASRRLLIPDSPTGQLFAVSLTGTATPTLLGAGLGRPVAATIDAAGDVAVASESSPALWVLPRSGVPRALGHFRDLDEVVAHAGLLYVADLAHGEVAAVDPLTGASVPVAVGLPTPQGLAVTEAGVLEIVDATTNTLYSMPACGVAA